MSTSLHNIADQLDALSAELRGSADEVVLGTYEVGTPPPEVNPEPPEDLHPQPVKGK